MRQIDFNNAYYIKLGRNGEWEESSISESKLRIGWSLQDVEDIKEGRREAFVKRLSQGTSKKGVATKEWNALRLICESIEQDIWITFHSSKLWWCRVGSSEILEDQTSRYRKVDEWSSRDVHGNDLLVNRISGKLSKIQRFQGTVCRVNERETLKRLLNDEPSPEHKEIQSSRRTLISNVQEGIRNLHWKDFELFVDLLFRQSGWRRLSMLGETMKYVDLELEDPITHDRYHVQVKSRATLNDFNKYSNQFGEGGYRKLYFVVHTHNADLAMNQDGTQDVELVLPERLAEMAVDLGLVEWLMHRIK